MFVIYFCINSVTEFCLGSRRTVFFFMRVCACFKTRITRSRKTSHEAAAPSLLPHRRVEPKTQTGTNENKFIGIENRHHGERIGEVVMLISIPMEDNSVSSLRLGVPARGSETNKQLK